MLQPASASRGSRAGAGGHGGCGALLPCRRGRVSGASLSLGRSDHRQVCPGAGHAFQDAFCQLICRGELSPPWAVLSPGPGPGPVLCRWEAMLRGSPVPRRSPPLQQCRGCLWQEQPVGEERPRYQHTCCGLVMFPVRVISVNPGPLCGKSRPQLLSGLPELFLLWHSRTWCVRLATAFFILRLFLFFFLPGVMVSSLPPATPGGRALVPRTAGAGVQHGAAARGVRGCSSQPLDFMSDLWLRSVLFVSP